MELNLSGEDKEDKEEIMGKKAMLGKKLYPAAAKGPVLGEVTNKYGRGSERKLGGVGKGKVMERTVVEEGVEEEGGGQSELVMVSFVERGGEAAEERSPPPPPLTHLNTPLSLPVTLTLPPSLPDQTHIINPIAFPRVS